MTDRGESLGSSTKAAKLVPAVGPLPPFAFQVYSKVGRVWFGSAGKDAAEVVFASKLGTQASALFLRGGFVIVDFGQSFDDGGCIPAYTEPEPGSIPANIWKSRENREAVADRRCSFMNALLGALHSVETQSDRDLDLQEPIHPGNRLAVWRSASGAVEVTELQAGDKENKKSNKKSNVVGRLSSTKQPRSSSHHLMLPMAKAGSCSACFT